MIESRHFGSREKGLEMITMTGKAVLRAQHLMEWRSAAGWCDRDALGCPSSYVGWIVTPHATLGGWPAEGRMTGEAVRREFCVSRHQRTWADHCARVDKGEPDGDCQQGGCCNHDPAGHRQAQNRKMLRM